MVEDPYDVDSLGFPIAAFRLHHLHESEADKAARESKEESPEKEQLGFRPPTQKVTENVAPKDPNVPRHYCGQEGCPFEGMSEEEMKVLISQVKQVLEAQARG
jgi:hypothetical protein